MTYTGVVFSLKSGFKKIVLTQELILVLNLVSRKYCLDQFFLYSFLYTQFESQENTQLSGVTFKLNKHQRKSTSREGMEQPI